MSQPVQPRPIAHTRTFTLRVPTGPHTLRIVRVPAGLPILRIETPRIRHDTGARLMPGYVRVTLAQPFAPLGIDRVLYTMRENLRGIHETH